MCWHMVVQIPPTLQSQNVFYSLERSTKRRYCRAELSLGKYAALENVLCWYSRRNCKAAWMHRFIASANMKKPWNQRSGEWEEVMELCTRDAWRKDLGMGTLCLSTSAPSLWGEKCNIPCAIATYQVLLNFLFCKTASGILLYQQSPASQQHPDRCQ